MTGPVTSKVNHKSDVDKVDNVEEIRQISTKPKNKGKNENCGQLKNIKKSTSFIPKKGVKLVDKVDNFY